MRARSSRDGSIGRPAKTVQVSMPRRSVRSWSCRRSRRPCRAGGTVMQRLVEGEARRPPLVQQRLGGRPPIGGRRPRRSSTDGGRRPHSGRGPRVTVPAARHGRRDRRAAPRAARAVGIETWTVFAGRPDRPIPRRPRPHRRRPPSVNGSGSGSSFAAPRVARGCGPGWPSSASTPCSCRWGRTSRTSPGTRRCRSSGSRCSCSRPTATPRWWCPRLEAPRVVERPDVFALRSWDETDDPVAIVAELVGRVNRSPSVIARGRAS